MPELAGPPVFGTESDPGAHTRSLHAHVRFWFSCAGEPQLGQGHTLVVTAAEPPRAPCEITGLAGGVASSLLRSHVHQGGLAHATQILALTHVPVGQIRAGDVFVSASRTPLNQPEHDWPSGVVFGVRSYSSPPPTHISPPPPTLVLRDLMRSIGGSADVVAETLGASRRSVYNWLKGKPVRSEFALRAERLQAVLSPLEDEWHPEALSAWLQSGSPSPAGLAAEERWVELEEQVRLAMAPALPETDAPEEFGGDPEAWPSSAVLAVLSEFNSPPPAPARKSAWRPRELTGSTPLLDEE